MQADDPTAYVLSYMNALHWPEERERFRVLSARWATGEAGRGQPGSTKVVVAECRYGEDGELLVLEVWEHPKNGGEALHIFRPKITPTPSGSGALSTALPDTPETPGGTRHD